MSLLLKMSIGAAKIIPHESFKDNYCSIAMQIEVLKFHCVNLQIFLKLSKLDLWDFLVS